MLRYEFDAAFFGIAEPYKRDTHGYSSEMNQTEIAYVTWLVQGLPSLGCWRF